MHTPVQVLTRCRDAFGPQIDSYFKAPVFLKFEQDANGCISANQFLNYLNLRNTTQQNVRGLGRVHAGQGLRSRRETHGLLVRQGIQHRMHGGPLCLVPGTVEGLLAHAIHLLPAAAGPERV